MYIKHIHEYSFNKGYLRLSARSAKLSDHYAYLLKQIGSFYVYEGAGLNMKDLIYGQYRNSGIDFSPVIAAYLLQENQEAIGYCKDVLLSENNTGVISRHLIMAIEMSSNEELQDLLIQVFLAARLQEGLRQSIAETCDEFTIGFFKKALQCIIDHNLIRYSSIQRAVLTWCGLGTDHFEERDVKILLALFDKYVLNSCSIEQALKEENPLELYLALYSIGVEDNDKAVHLALSYLDLEDTHKVASVLTYLRLSNVFKSEEHLYLFDKYKDNDWIMALFFNQMPYDHINISKDKAYEYFIKIEQYLRTFKNKKKVKTKGFEWFEMNLESYTIVRLLFQLVRISKSKETVTLFLPYIRHITFHKEYENFIKNDIKLVDEDIRKKFYIKNLSVSDDRLQNKCKEALCEMKLTDNDIKSIEEKLKSKRSETRTAVLEIINKQHIDLIIRSHDRLKDSKDEYQRNGAKDLERKYPEVFHYKQEKIFYSLDEGFNLFTPKKILEKPHPSYLNIKKEGLLVRREKVIPQYNFKSNQKEVIEILNKWSQFYVDHENDTYSINGNEYLLSQYLIRDFSKKDFLESLPLSHMWIDFFEKNPISNETLRTIYIINQARNINEIKTGQLTLKDIFGIEEKYNIPDIPYINNIYIILTGFYKTRVISQFMCDIELLELFLRYNKHATLRYSYINSDYNITQNGFISFIIKSVETGWSNDNEFKIAFDLIYDYYMKYCIHTLRKDSYIPSPMFFIKAYQYDLITRDEFYSILFNSKLLYKAFSQCYYMDRNYQFSKIHLELYNLPPYSKEDNRVLRSILAEITDTFLKMETHRLNEDTPVTQYLNEIRMIKGIQYLPMILNALGKDSFSRSSWGKDKKTILTNLIKNTYPDKDNDLSFLDNIPETKLVEICMLAPQWIEIIAEYLNWDGFVEGCNYFIAHMKDYDTDRKKAMIARYTELEPVDLIDGAFDASWCREVYNRLGTKRFDILYKAAKYLCDNAFHTRARKYADACLNKLDKESVLKEIKEKRNKDLLNAYCIIPLSDDNDLKERYLYLQQFLKESKQFGSQRQASEKRSTEIALMNLARNSKYENSTRLTWNMETKIVTDNIDVLNPHKIDEYHIYLQINDLGKNEICIINSKGKSQKTIPAKVKRLESFIEIQTIHKQWNEQYRRSKKMLEEAMEDRIEFYKEELLTILDNPVIAPMISKLLFLQGNHIGYIKNNQLYCLGDIYPLEDKLRIAHCYDLYKSGNWQQYQQEVFDLKLVQPFKQVFRELYIKLDEELDKNTSNRYSGYQIQIKKAIGALKSRKWNINYESGIERIYYKDNLIVNLYAEADWFSPSDIEAPAIEYVAFYDRKNYQNVFIKDIDDITYSETMRDLDMVCSVAYVGGVDPITSFSTIELRKSIVLLTARLMKLTNITIKDNFVHILGKLGEYNVHLGSGIIHQKHGSTIHVLPIHSQRRGKLYLPFIDEDPKCQEIISKIIMLSEDYKLKDPTVLSQIK